MQSREIVRYLFAVLRTEPSASSWLICPVKVTVWGVFVFETKSILDQPGICHVAKDDLELLTFFLLVFPGVYPHTLFVLLDVKPSASCIAY